MDNFSPYEQWQINRFGNIAPTIDQITLTDYIENGCEDADRFREWVLQREEIQLMEYENQNRGE